MSWEVYKWTKTVAPDFRWWIETYDTKRPKDIRPQLELYVPAERQMAKHLRMLGCLQTGHTATFLPPVHIFVGSKMKSE